MLNSIRSQNTSIQLANSSKSPPDNDELEKTQSTPFVYNLKNSFVIDNQKFQEARGKLAESRPDSSYIRLGSSQQKVKDEVEQSQCVECVESSNVVPTEQITDTDIDSKALLWETIQEIQHLSARDKNEVPNLDLNTDVRPKVRPCRMQLAHVRPHEQMFLANLSVVSVHQSDNLQTSNFTKRLEISWQTSSSSKPREISIPAGKKIWSEKYRKAEEERKLALHGNSEDVLPDLSSNCKPQDNADHAEDASFKPPPKKLLRRRRETLVMPAKSKAIPKKRALNDQTKKNVLSIVKRSADKRVASVIKIESCVDENSNKLSKEKEDELKEYYQITESSVCLSVECQPFFAPVSKIAFAKPVRSQFGVIIKCVSGCTFQQTFKGIKYMRETMSIHLSQHHPREKWNGFCSTCLKYVFNPDKEKTRWKFIMTNEIEHIINFHLKGHNRHA